MGDLDLKLIREFVLDLPLREFGARVGYSHTAISKFEQDYPIPHDFRRKLKRAFDLSDEDFECIRRAAELISTVKSKRQ